MPLVELTRSEQEEFREAAERAVSRVVDREVRAWLADVLAVIREGLNEGLPSGALVAAGADLPLNLGTMTRWWADRVNGDVQEAIRQVWEEAYTRTRPGELLSSSLDRLDTFMAAVTDRLVRGLVPPLPDDAMDRVRVVITQSAALGWSTQRTSQNLATALAWEQDGRALRKEYDRITRDIEDILDPLGPPGTPAREAAREGDPRVRALQTLRAQTVVALDNEKSHWQVRADRIARTESTAAYNFANLTALADEGWTHKEWMATRDTRTREAHVDLDGQVVPIAAPFIVDGLPIFMPGDPSAAPHLTINCRCILVGADAPEGEAEMTAAQIEQERGPFVPTADDYARRDVSPLAVERAGWLDEPRPAAEAVETVNPLYNKDPNAGINCQKTTTAFELQRRGIDAYASLGSGGPMYLNGNSSLGKAFNAWWSGPEAWYRSSLFKRRGPNKHDDLAANIAKDFEVGARGSVIVRWTNSRSSHIFNWERTADGVQFWDAQPGKRYDRDDEVWTRMKQDISYNRLDNATFLPAGERALEDKDALEEAAKGVLTTAERIALVEDLTFWTNRAIEMNSRLNDPSQTEDQREFAQESLDRAMARIAELKPRLEAATAAASSTIATR